MVCRKRKRPIRLYFVLALPLWANRTSPQIGVLKLETGAREIIKRAFQRPTLLICLWNSSLRDVSYLDGGYSAWNQLLFRGRSVPTWPEKIRYVLMNDMNYHEQDYVWFQKPSWIPTFFSILSLSLLTCHHHRWVSGIALSVSSSSNGFGLRM